MDRRPLDRRRLIGGIGAASVATGLGLGPGGLGNVLADGSGNRSDSQNDGAATVGPSAPSPSARSLTTTGPFVVALGAIDFHPATHADYTYVIPGGVRLDSGSEFFNAGVRVPVGATIVGARVFINPNGAPRTVNLTRYRPLEPAFDSFATGTSTNGTESEAIELANAGGHVVEAGYNYRFDNLSLSAAAPTILYGAEVTYELPEPEPEPEPDEEPGGEFVAYPGANPRVYDSRAVGTPVAAGEERLVPLGVAGTVRAAVFNLTATQTQAPGFLSAYRADIDWPGNSSVNWIAAGVDVANLVICEVDGEGRIKVRGGDATTHVIVDMIGTFE